MAGALVTRNSIKHDRQMAMGIGEPTAGKIAFDLNSSDRDGWSYLAVVRDDTSPHWYIIEVRDTDGELLGYL